MVRNMRIETAKRVLKSRQFAKELAEKRGSDASHIKFEARETLNNVSRRRERLDNHKGSWCVVKPIVFYQEGYCPDCQIYLDSLESNEVPPYES